MAYSQRHPDKQNNINELIKKYPNTIQILMKIACEDDYRTPGIFDVAIQILDQHQATPEALGALFETIADIPYPYAEFDIQRSLPMEAPYSPTIKKTIISLNTYPNIGIALKNICKSELRGEDFAIWKNNQFGNDIEQGRIAEIKSGVQCNPRKRSCVKKSPKETSEEFSM
ncbi:MAG: hypothetical protein LBJ13_02515 [Puniceicoccales bacterium]|nr:hypothetical protein [Puniceicoccales bacterium]